MHHSKASGQAPAGTALKFRLWQPRSGPGRTARCDKRTVRSGRKPGARSLPQRAFVSNGDPRAGALYRSSLSTNQCKGHMRGQAGPQVHTECAPTTERPFHRHLGDEPYTRALAWRLSGACAGRRGRRRAAPEGTSLRRRKAPGCGGGACVRSARSRWRGGALPVRRRRRAAVAAVGEGSSGRFGRLLEKAPRALGGPASI